MAKPIRDSSRFCAVGAAWVTIVLVSLGMVAAGRTDAADGGIRWQFDAGGCVGQTPTITGRHVLIGTCQNQLVRALDRYTGQPFWATHVEPAHGPNYFHSDPYMVDGMLIIGADNGPPPSSAVARVHAIDITTGREVWSREAGRGVAGRIVGRGTRVYAVTLDGQLLALDARSGAVRWSFPVRVFGWEGPEADENRVYVGARDGALMALDAERGSIVWQTRLKSGITTSVTATGRSLYFGTADGVLHRADRYTGALLHSIPLDTALRPRSVPLVIGDRVVVLLGDRSENFTTLVSVDAGLAGVLWRRTADTRWHTTRIFTLAGAAFLGTPEGAVSAYCLSDGRTNWSRSVRGMVRSISGDADGLFVGTTEGMFYGLEPPSRCGATGERAASGMESTSAVRKRGTEW